MRALALTVRARCVRLDDWFVRLLGDDRGHAGRFALVAVVILAIAAALMLHRLGRAEICGFNEAVEALVVQDMLERGNLLFPRVSVDQPAYKPPLVHWTALALARLLGLRRISELSVRLPSVLFALGGVALVLGFSYRRFGAHSAALAGLILVAAWQYIRQARFGRVDMALTLFETATLVLFAIWAARQERGSPRPYAHLWLWGVSLAAGAGVLAKGPVGALLPLGAIVMTLVLDRRWAIARRALRWGPALALVVLSGSWYAMLALGAQQDFLALHLGTENVGRFSGALGRMPIWYYLEPLLLNSPPLSLLAPFAVVAVLRRRVRSPTRSSRDDAASLFAVFWVLSVVFFSLAAYKRRAYLLPVWPAAAMLIAEWLSARARTFNGRALRGAVAAICGGLIVINLIVFPIVETRRCPPGRFAMAAEAVRAVVPPGATLVSEGGTGGGDLAAMRLYLRHPLPPRELAPPGVLRPYVLRFLPRGATALSVPGEKALLAFRPGRGTITLWRPEPLR